MEKQNIETELQDAGCPLFFSWDCKVKVTDHIFQTYCLENYKQCETYNHIEIKTINNRWRIP